MDSGWFEYSQELRDFLDVRKLCASSQLLLTKFQEVMNLEQNQQQNDNIDSPCATFKTSTDSSPELSIDPFKDFVKQQLTLHLSGQDCAVCGKAIEWDFDSMPSHAKPGSLFHSYHPLTGNENYCQRQAEAASRRCFASSIGPYRGKVIPACPTFTCQTAGYYSRKSELWEDYQTEYGYAYPTSRARDKAIEAKCKTHVRSMCSRGCGRYVHSYMHWRDGTKQYTATTLGAKKAAIHCGKPDCNPSGSSGLD